MITIILLPLLGCSSAITDEHSAPQTFGHLEGVQLFTCIQFERQQWGAQTDRCKVELIFHQPNQGPFPPPQELDPEGAQDRGERAVGRRHREDRDLVALHVLGAEQVDRGNVDASRQQSAVDHEPATLGVAEGLQARLAQLNATKLESAYCAATSEVNALAVATHSVTQFITPWLDADFECDMASSLLPAMWTVDYCKYPLLPLASCLEELDMSDGTCGGTMPSDEAWSTYSCLCIGSHNCCSSAWFFFSKC